MARSRVPLWLLVTCLLAGPAFAAPQTVKFREGGGTGYIDVTFDDTAVENYYPNNTFGNDGNIQTTPDSGDTYSALMAVKGLFTQLPKTSGGGTISISSAVLHLTRYNAGSSSDVAKVYRCTTNWLPGSAGTNENDISWNHADISADTHWGGGSSFSTSDYDTSVCKTGYWVSTYDQVCDLTITDVVADIYDAEVNYGLVIKATATISFRSSEATASKRPSLEITYEYVGSTYALTVNSGSGDGNYAQSTVVDITADAAPSGKAFDKWTGNTSGIANVNASSTTLTMPAAAQTITATYVNVYVLTVNSGSGGGSYKQSEVANISANTAPSGYQFDKWTGNTSGIANVNAASTTLTMPAAAQTITATYAAITYTLTVNSGGGDGNYTAGTVANISADTAPSGYQFDKWVGNTSGIANVNVASTTLTMPAAAQTVTATYAANTYALTVNSGGGDGNYAVGTQANISADTAPSGMLFDKWTGNTSGIADVNDPTTTLTMPAAAQTITAAYTWVASSLVSRFTFDIDARDSIGSNNGTLTGGALVTTDGTRGKVLSLDGTDDYVSLPSGGMAAGRSEVTLSLWVKPDTWAGGRTIYEEYASSSYWQFTLIYGGYYTRDSSTGTTGARDNDLSVPSLTTGQWQHIAATYSVSGGRKAIYVNGAEMSSTTTSIDALTSTRDGVAIGYASDGTDFDGLIDDVRLYSRALNGTEIAYLAEQTLYTLTVNSGTGGGTYVSGQVVNISANAAPSGYLFDKWVGNTSGIANVNASSTTLTMPAANQTVTAAYAAITYALTVNSGGGDGNYAAGTVVNISADTAPSGYQFDKWTGNTSGIANVNAASTTLTMPAAAQTVTATYAVITYALTVNSGGGDGNYTPGTVVNISADAAPSGKTFDKWTGNTSGIADVNASSTTLTMPAANQTITATYRDLGYTLTVNSGGGDGNYAQGTQVNISADTAASGMLFDKWTGNTSGIADVNDPTTTLTMPASNQTVTATYTWVASGLVSRFTFDTDARDTIGSNSGTLTGGAAVATDGTRGKVLSLDGTDDYVSLPSGGMAAGRSELTLAVWVKPDTWASGRTIYDEYAETSYWQFTLLYGGYYTRDSSTGTTGSRNNDLSLPSLTTGQWQHIAVTYSTSGAKKEVFLNGASQSSSSTSIDTLTSTRTGVGIGYAADGIYFDGVIDDLRLYNRALNSTEIAYLAEQTLYTLTVNSGTGGGSYVSSQVVSIVANAAPSGYVFSKWTGNTSGIANVNGSSTTLTMPAANQTITATYSQTTTYTLTVNSGTGGGNYAASTVVNISANAAPSGYQFNKWSGNTSGIANVNASSTTLTMPAANQTITATYSQLTTYTLTVNSGSGDGSYTASTVVNISADAAPSGKTFDKWVGNTSGIANANASSTTLTMPAANQTITATYVDAGSGPSISSTSGTWGQGNSITISGSGFGSKSQAAPKVWDNFESGANGNSIDGASPVVGPSWGVLTSHGTPPKYSNVANRTNSSLCSRHDFVVSGQYNCSLQYNQTTDTAYFTYWWKYDLQGTQFNRNTKPWVEYGTEGYFPLLYIGFGNPDYSDGGLRTSIQDDPEPSGSTEWGGTNLSSIENEWIRLEVWLVQSGVNVSDGTFKTWVHRPYAGSPSIVLDLDHENRMMRTGSSQWTQWTIGSYVARDVDPYGGGGPIDVYTYVDDFYFDVTRARVEVGNASTWSGCTQREMQIPSAWSSSSVTISANKGSFSSFSGKYLYVVDSNGNVNSNGYAIN